MTVLYRKILDLLGISVGLSIGLIALAIPLDLLVRWLRITSFPWLSEIVEYTLFAGVFLAAPWVLALNAHVKVDLLASALPRRLSVALDVFLNLLGCLIAFGFIWFAVTGAIDAFKFETMIRRSLNVPEWWLLALFTFSMALIALEFCMRTRRDIRSWTALKDGA